MPFTIPSRPPAGPRRRSLLTGAASAALLLTGCSAADGGSSALDGTGKGAADAARLRKGAVADSDALLRQYDAVVKAHPDTAELLAPLRAEVARHRVAFGGARPSAPASPTTASPSASASVSPSAGRPERADQADQADQADRADRARRPGQEAEDGGQDEKDRKAALRDLAAAERALADRRGKALIEAPGELSRLLASVAAAGAAHAYLLTEGQK